MKRFVVFALACAAGLVTATAVQAMLIAPPAIPIRVANADLIVVGKVTTIAGKTEDADLSNNDKRQIQIATVKVEDKLMGNAGREIKVGFIAPPAAGPGGGVRVIVRPAPIRLSVGQEAALFLTKHPTRKDLYIILAYHEVLNKSLPNFAAQKDEIKKYARIMSNPKPTLKSKDAEERFVTAAMLISRYRTPRRDNKTEVVPAEESKLLLLALAEADWASKPTRGFYLTPQGIFYRLGLGVKDGWTPPANAKALPEEAKKWLKANAGKYKLERYIAPKLEPSSEPSSDK